jgi:hypothetical protein
MIFNDTILYLKLYLILIFLNMTSKITLFVFKILYTNWLVWFCEGLKSFKERIKNKKTKKKIRLSWIFDW